MTIDDMDRKILRLLQADGSLSFNELAERVGMTPPPCWRRVRRLKEAGILQKQVWLIDPEAVGLGVMIYASLKLTTHDYKATSAFRDQIRLLPEVLECYILLGGIDVLLKIAVSSIRYYEEFFYQRLSQIAAIREVTSSVVVSEVKRTLELPL